CTRKSDTIVAANFHYW
nr:immunoglobulin heavy chain junction region [Macaca mulatta]